MPILTIQYEREEFAIAVGALVHFAAQAGEQVSVRRSEHPASEAQGANGNHGYGAYGGGYAGVGGDKPWGQAHAEAAAPPSAPPSAPAPAPPTAATPTPAFGEKVCADCGMNTHSTDYKRCFDCAQALSEQYVDCADCNGANRHRKGYRRCYECNKARKAS